MATTNIQIASIPNAYGLIAVYNDSSTDIADSVPVQLDTGYILDNAGKNLLGVKIPTTGGDPSQCFFVTKGTIPAKGTGLVQSAFPVVVGTAAGAITVATKVDAGATTAGTIVAHTSNKAYLGWALATAADGDVIPYLLAPGITG